MGGLGTFQRMNGTYKFGLVGYRVTSAPTVLTHKRSSVFGSQHGIGRQSRAKRHSKSIPKPFRSSAINVEFGEVQNRDSCVPGRDLSWDYTYALLAVTLQGSNGSFVAKR